MTYSAINEAMNDTIDDGTDVTEINENLLFNNSLLEECKKHSPRIEVDLNKYGGTLSREELDLYGLKHIHPVGAPLVNQITGEVDYPNGLQIRANMVTDSEAVEKFRHIIKNRKWDPRRDQIILIELPEEYQYVRPDGTKVIYGIIDGNHRIDGATGIEENVIAWLIDMPLTRIRKYGNAVCNRDDNVVKDRSDEDIVETIVIDLKDSNTDLHKATKEAEKGEDEDQNNISKENIWRKEIDDYNVHPKKAEALLRKLLCADSGFETGRKPWDSTRMFRFIDEESIECKNWIKNTDKNSLYDYEAPGNRKILICQAEGKNDLIQAHRYAQCINEDPTAKVEIYFALAKRDKPTKATLDILRKKFQGRIMKILKQMHDGYEAVRVTRTANQPYWGFFPENATELKGNKFLHDIDF